MRKFTAILLALLLALSMAACGQSAQQPEPTPTPDLAEPAPEPTPEVTPDDNETQGGETCSFEELEGVWLQTGYEIEGDMGETMPHDFNSLVFKASGETLLASSEEWYI
ncbi:MAG: hypothetical protein J6S18_00485, partial [Oscillospiraceae bacterium]|nr:hypothetical protein [Oscillospiraceae bacterium]